MPDQPPPTSADATADAGFCCPICRKAVRDDVGQPGSTFPFCCDRCRLVDLGRWFDGKYLVPLDGDDQAD